MAENLPTASGHLPHAASVRAVVFRSASREEPLTRPLAPQSRGEGTGMNNRSEWQRSATGIAVSALVHLVAFGLAALIAFKGTPASTEATLDSSWSAPETPVVEITQSREPITETQPSGDSADPGGSSLAELIDLAQIASSDELPVVDELVANTQGLSTVRSRTPVTAVKRATSENKGSTKPGAGQGRGAGDGIGDGKGFFGSVPGGKRIVFVVDSSRSMNHRHDSPFKTRFRRLKVELIKAILELPADHEFFVIFFANEMLAMPAESLQPATPQAKDRYLRWVAQVDPGGSPTDPLDAMAAAIRLQPDIIYFLTDGEFKKGVNLRLRSIKLPRTTIHTFAFGETVGEALLKEVAQNNGGEYTFVP